MIPHNPWRHLAQHHPDVNVIWTHLGGQRRGCTDGHTIWMDSRLTQAQRRVVICHETIHIERGIIPADPTEEARVNRLTAERLITLPHLIDALRWHQHPSPHALAEALWVDPECVRTRLDTMSPAEHAVVEHALLEAA